MPAAKIIDTYNVMLLRAGWNVMTNRFYPKKALQNLHAQFSTPILGDFVFLGDQTFTRLDIAYASHRTNRLYLRHDDTELWGEIQVLDTSCGAVVKDLYKTNNIRFDCLHMGNPNAHDEVIADSVQLLRVIAYGVF